MTLRSLDFCLQILASHTNTQRYMMIRTFFICHIGFCKVDEGRDTNHRFNLMFSTDGVKPDFADQDFDVSSSLFALISVIERSYSSAMITT
jgi:hypothetical protein